MYYVGTVIVGLLVANAVVAFFVAFFLAVKGHSCTLQNVGLAKRAGSLACAREPE
jgi:hypothetical protein